MISTLSCSMSLRAIRVVVAGVVSVAATTVSIFLPPAVPPASLSASSTLRTPSAPPAAKAPSSATRIPTLIVSCATAAPGSINATAAPAPMSRFMPNPPRIDDRPRLVQPPPSAASSSAAVALTL